MLVGACRGNFLACVAFCLLVLSILYILSILCHPASVLSGNPRGALVSRSSAMVEAKHIDLHPTRRIAMVELTSEAPGCTQLHWNKWLLNSTALTFQKVNFVHALVVATDMR